MGILSLRPPIERKFDESGKRLLQQADKVRARVIALASAWRLTGERKYAAAAIGCAWP